MCTEQETEKIIKKAAAEFFKNNMLGKDMDTVLFEVTYETLLKIGALIGKLQVMLVCLEAIKDNTPYFEKLDRDTQERLEMTIRGLNKIGNKLEDILNPIIENLEN